MLPHDTNLDPPAVTSYPQDPGRPSFLDRPPEIRNAIYEALFLLDDPITITHAKSTAPFPGIKLLSTCRQIHKEASGVLYSRNFFRITARDEFYVDTYQVGEWLQTIGTSKNLLRVLDIDIGTLCSWPRCGSKNEIELLSLLEQKLPSISSGTLQVSFVPWAWKICDCCGRTLGIEHPGIQKLNSSFKSLYHQQMFELRPYLRCLESVRSFTIRADGSRIDLAFGDKEDDEQPVLSFTETCGQFRRIASTKQPTNLTDILTSSLGHVILDSVAPANAETVYSLNDKTVSSEIPSILQVNQAIRNVGGDFFLGRLQTVKLSTENTEHGFERFALLEDWMNQRPSFHKFRWSDYRLHFDLKTMKCNSLASTLLKATDLVRATRFLHSDTKLYFRMINTDSQQLYDQSLIDLYKIRFNLLAFLVYLIRSYPNRLLLPCPIIWADCQGEILRADFESEGDETETITNTIFGRVPENHVEMEEAYVEEIDLKFSELQDAGRQVGGLVEVAMDLCSMME